MKHKVKHEHIWLPEVGAPACDLINSFPRFLGAEAFHNVVDAMMNSFVDRKEIVFAMGGHVIKTGCSMIICDLIERGLITGISVNGAFAIHDVEMALFGSTSEDVGEGVKDGSFGMNQETVDFFREILYLERSNITGFGYSIGQFLHAKKIVAPSILHSAYMNNVPTFVHIALGTDTIHMHDLDFGTMGTSSMYDFRQLCELIRNLGTWVNIGSAVILPEVFLKAITYVRSQGIALNDIYTANFDMINHYRPHQNVVTRPVKEGHGFNIIGHHEIMLPLLRQAVIDHPNIKAACVKRANNKE
jgi:hypothetical protein